ncbi:MAG: hypothetical protein HKN04_01085 [Rhodothermaceae bacterium]|nr:hypothetical protein [Rhodothermaceae bacterium]
MPSPRDEPVFPPAPSSPPIFFAYTDEGRVCLNEKVAFLKNPASYPDRPAAVEAIETKMAWVFLTDRFAYKLKKPMRTPFLEVAPLVRVQIHAEGGTDPLAERASSVEGKEVKIGESHR